MPSVQAKGYAFQMEIILSAQNLGYHIEEVPIVFVERIFGESKLSAKEVKSYVLGLWKLVWQF